MLNSHAIPEKNCDCEDGEMFLFEVCFSLKLIFLLSICAE